jgi:hypothetical protein
MSSNGKLSLATKQASSPLRKVVNAKKTVIPKGKAEQKKVEITPSSKQKKVEITPSSKQKKVEITPSSKQEKAAKRAPEQSTGFPAQKKSFLVPKPKSIHHELLMRQPSSECGESEDELGDYDLTQYGIGSISDGED